jgi:hypothetical protein
MAQSLCIKCGSELKVSSYCHLCKEPLIFACTSCDYITEEKVHIDCRNAEVLAKTAATTTQEGAAISRQRFVDPTQLTNHGKYVKVDLEKLINKVYLSSGAPSYFKEAVESIILKYGLRKEVVKSDLYTLK